MPLPIASDAVTKAFQTVGNEWALLSAGDESQFNTMTISWGSLGFIWGRPVVTVLVRPQRYTREFIDRCDKFSVSFYKGQRKALSLLGTKSGRESAKIAQSGLTPLFIDGVPTFREAYLTVIARKLYRGQLEPGQFLVPAVESEFYPKKDHHTVYIAELIQTVGDSV